ncbi:MAG: hypothetical protein JNK82_37845 [Myxococcaceae bacterium]|nr:hypothetical protein [Myxococcaceae bacterium]
MKRALVLLPLLAACSRDFVEGSDFTYSDEEWSLETEFGLVNMSLVEGDLSGAPPYLCGSDTGFSGARFWRFKAPQKYVGNAGRAFQKRLTWSTMTEFPTNTLINANDVFLVGRGLAIVVNVPNVASRKTREWAQFSVYLDDRSDWRNVRDGAKVTNDEIESVLRNLTELKLPGEWVDGAETTCIDDVYFGTP